MHLHAAVSLPTRGIRTTQCAIQAAFVCLAAIALHAAGDPNEIVRQALKINAHNSELERSYTYVERQESRTVDGSGAVKSRESHTWDITRLQGSMYRRLIQHNDKPLTPKEEAEQQAIQKKRAAVRAAETPEQKQKRLDTRERNRKEQQAQLTEVPNAFDLRIVGEEQIDGIPVWIIEGTPRKDYKPKSKELSFFSKMKGRIWVSKSDYQPVKIEAETTDTISIGAFLARVHKGFRIHAEFARVNDEVWLPKFFSIAGSARVLLVKGFHIDQETAYSSYKKFTAESRVIDTIQ